MSSNKKPNTANDKLLEPPLMLLRQPFRSASKDEMALLTVSSANLGNSFKLFKNGSHILHRALHLVREVLGIWLLKYHRAGQWQLALAYSQLSLYVEAMHQTSQGVEDICLG